MKMKPLFILCSFAFTLCGCALLKPVSSTPSNGTVSSNSGNHSDESLSSNSGNSSNGSSSSEQPEEDYVIKGMSLNKRVLDLVKTKYEYLTVNFELEEIDDSYKDGVWSTSDESIATVSQYGKVTAVKAGIAVITYTTTKEIHSASCTVYVYNSASDIVREYQKVTDADSIKNGDIIVFGCPELGVAASINQYNGYVLPATATFTSNKMTSWSEDVAEFFVGEGKNGGLTLETQDGKYLNGKTNDYHNGLTYIKSTKGSVNWIFEKPDGYQDIYCVNNDIAEDLWLMFNKINNSDIRFNLYDSNPTELMKMPTIYRWTVVR